MWGRITLAEFSPNRQHGKRFIKANLTSTEYHRTGLLTSTKFHYCTMYHNFYGDRKCCRPLGSTLLRTISRPAKDFSISSSWSFGCVQLLRRIPIRSLWWTFLLVLLSLLLLTRTAGTTPVLLDCQSGDHEWQLWPLHWKLTTCCYIIATRCWRHYFPTYWRREYVGNYSYLVPSSRTLRSGSVHVRDQHSPKGLTDMP